MGLRFYQALGLVVLMVGLLFGLAQDQATAGPHFVLYPAPIASQQNGAGGGGDDGRG